jgi:hypothetical protein
MPAAHGRWPPSRSGERAGSRPTERFDANVTPARARVKRLPLLSRATPPHRRPVDEPCPRWGLLVRVVLGRSAIQVSATAGDSLALSRLTRSRAPSP